MEKNKEIKQVNVCLEFKPVGSEIPKEQELLILNIKSEDDECCTIPGFSLNGNFLDVHGLSLDGYVLHWAYFPSTKENVLKYIGWQFKSTIDGAWENGLPDADEDFKQVVSYSQDVRDIFAVVGEYDGDQ